MCGSVCHRDAETTRNKLRTNKSHLQIVGQKPWMDTWEMPASFSNSTTVILRSYWISCRTFSIIGIPGTFWLPYVKQVRKHTLIIAYLHFVLKIFNLSNHISEDLGSLLYYVNTGTDFTSDNRRVNCLILNHRSRPITEIFSLKFICLFGLNLRPSILLISPILLDSNKRKI